MHMHALFLPSRLQRYGKFTITIEIESQVYGLIDRAELRRRLGKSFPLAVGVSTLQHCDSS